MKTVTPTQLRSDIYNLLEEVLTTGQPLEIKKGNRKLLIIPAEPLDKLKRLASRPQLIQGDPDELVAMNWADVEN